MSIRSSLVALGLMGAVALHAADGALSRQHADAFQRKILLIADTQRVQKVGSRRTPLTESELNSWFAFTGQPLVPKGIEQPRISMIGQGRVMGEAIVDLDVIAKKKASGGALDPWSYVGGRMPVSVKGILHTKDGIGRFQLESAEVSGVPVPKMLLQEVVAYYSRTPDHPSGVSMDDPFELPAGIRRIEVGQGEAVVVQ
jgi:hypothetical protein